MIKLKAQKKKALLFEVEMEGDVKQYALNWLNITNNVRERRGLLKAYNDSGNTVYVLCEEEYRESVADWLGWFGTVSVPQEVVCIEPVIVDDLLTDEEFNLICNSEWLPVSDEI